MNSERSAQLGLTRLKKGSVSDQESLPFLAVLRLSQCSDSVGRPQERELDFDDKPGGKVIRRARCNC